MAKRGVKQHIPDTTNWRDEKRKLSDELLDLQNKVNQLNITNKALLEENQSLLIDTSNKDSAPTNETEITELRDIINKLYVCNEALINENNLMKNYIINQNVIITNITDKSKINKNTELEIQAETKANEKIKAETEAIIEINKKIIEEIKAKAEEKYKELETQKNEEISVLTKRLENVQETNRRTSILNSDLYNKLNMTHRPIINVKVDEPLIKDLRNQIAEKDNIIHELTEKYTILETNLDMCGLISV